MMPPSVGWRRKGTVIASAAILNYIVLKKKIMEYPGGEGVDGYVSA